MAFRAPTRVEHTVESFAYLVPPLVAYGELLACVEGVLGVSQAAPTGLCPSLFLLLDLFDFSWGSEGLLLVDNQRALSRTWPDHALPVSLPQMGVKSILVLALQMVFCL